MIFSDLRFKVPVALMAAIVAHTTVLAQLRVFGVMPDLMLLLAVAAGLVAGPTYGAVVGFVTGMAADLFLPTPLGLSALVFTVIGYATGVTKGGLLRAVWWFPVAIAVAVSALGQALFALAGTMIGEPALLTWHLPAVMLVVGILNGLLALPVFRLVRWALDVRESPTAYAE